MKVVASLIFGIISSAIFSQNVTIPDANFKNYLLSNPAVNTNNDSEIQESEALAFTGTLAFQFYLIEDLTGIEAFTNLTVLVCGDNNLTSLDLSQNIALLELYCYDNQISTLDLSANTALQALDCRGNQILDLDVSANSSLQYLNCPFNGMLTLNVQNTALVTLRCYANQLTSLDVSSNVLLTTLACDYNDFSELDLSNNSALTIIDCDYNELTQLNVANGNNSNVTLFDARNNPSLECVQVDNETYANTHWTNIDGTTVFNEDCSSLSNDVFNTFNFSVYPNPVKDILNFNLPETASITIVTLEGKVIMAQRKLKGNNNIDMSIMSKGIYIVNITTTRKSYYSKVIKR